MSRLVVMRMGRLEMALFEVRKEVVLVELKKRRYVIKAGQRK